MVKEGIVAVWLRLIKTFLQILLHNGKQAKPTLENGGTANIS
jgi:hypothetical protein